MPGRDRDPDPPNTPVLGLLDTFLHDLPDRLAEALRRLGQSGQASVPGQQPAQPGGASAGPGSPPPSPVGPPPPPPPGNNPFAMQPQPPDPFGALGPLSRIAGSSGVPFGGVAGGELGRLATIYSSVRQLVDLFGRLGGVEAPAPPSRKAVALAARLARGRAPAPGFRGRLPGLPSVPERIPRLQSGPANQPPPRPAYPFPPAPPPVTQRRHARLDLEPPPSPLPPLRPGAPAAFPGAPPAGSQRRSARIDLSPPPPETEGLFGGVGAAGGVGGGPAAALAEVVEELRESVDGMNRSAGGGRRGADQRPFQEPVEGWPRRGGDGGDVPVRRGADQRPFVEPKDHDEGGAIAFARTLGTVLKTVAELA